MFLLDTNVVSEFRRRKPHGAVLAWISDQDAQLLFIPAVTLYELQAGAEVTRTHDPVKAREIESWIDEVAFSTRVLSFDGTSARLTAKLMAGKSQHVLEDAMIAAIAITHQITVATRNVRDFEQFGVPLFNPFEDRRLPPS